MLSERSLTGQRVAILAADGFEKIELTIPKHALRLAGADVEVVSLRPGRIRGVNLHEPASRVRVDAVVSHAEPAHYHALLIPGGFINPDLLRQSAEARRFVRAFDEAGKPIATLCHGPWVLASAGLVGGRSLTSWPGIRDDLVHAGAIWLDREVVHDRHWLTSRGPQDLKAFVAATIRLFGGERVPAAPVRESDPQREQPPALPIAAMRWLPRPSLRTAGLAAAVGAAVWAATRAQNGARELAQPHA